MVSRALLTDLYELTMAAGYLEQGKSRETAAFDLYFRQAPFQGSYAVAAGLEPALRAVTEMRFGDEDLAWLASLRGSSGVPLFRRGFLDWLRAFRFGGSMRAVAEGTLVFPNEPLVSVSGNLLECQIVESVLLCHVNFQTLVATKAARIREASGRGSVVEFGLRRAQGPDGAVSASRAAAIGGADGTSNVYSAARFGIPARGTQAHSFVQAFPSELEAFRAYARSYPDDCTLLVDTYDALRSGVPNAIVVARELARAGRRLAGIRIDSGDLASLSREARRMLDEAGLQEVRIVASGDLDEYGIAEVVIAGGKIDIWGVGTRLVTAAGEGGGALGGVYKLVEHNGNPVIKISGDPAKATTPGQKQIMRLFRKDGTMEGDVLALQAEDLSGPIIRVSDPLEPAKPKDLAPYGREPLLAEVVRNGEVSGDLPSLDSIRERAREELMRLDEGFRRLRNPLSYPVVLSPALRDTRERLVGEWTGRLPLA